LEIPESKVHAIPKEIVKQFLLSARKADPCKQKQAMNPTIQPDISQPKEVPKAVVKTKGKHLLPATNPM
jgi:hypothetical protein